MIFKSSFLLLVFSCTVLLVKGSGNRNYNPYQHYMDRAHDAYTDSEDHKRQSWELMQKAQQQPASSVGRQAMEFAANHKASRSKQLVQEGQQDATRAHQAWIRTTPQGSKVQTPKKTASWFLPKPPQ